MGSAPPWQASGGCTGHGVIREHCPPWQASGGSTGGEARLWPWRCPVACPGSHLAPARAFSRGGQESTGAACAGCTDAVWPDPTPPRVWLAQALVIAFARPVFSASKQGGQRPHPALQAAPSPWRLQSEHPVIAHSVGSACAVKLRYPFCSGHECKLPMHRASSMPEPCEGSGV